MAGYFQNTNWKDLLRPIRDGLQDGLDNIRDRLPDIRPQNPAEAKEQLKKLYRDKLHGFTYFDSFVDLLAWKADDVDPLQQSSVPLLPRPVAFDEGKDKKAKLLVCHDYAGGYHEYESVAPFRSNTEDFSLDYLQFVDTFVYFSHRLVSCPPPTWTNTLHRNGVKSLGTFIIESGTKHSDKMLSYTLKSDGTKSFPVADRLASLALSLGFDGYLINIERDFSHGSWNLDIMVEFLSNLRYRLGPKRKLVWYDALTKTGQVRYQNSLTTSNMVYFEVCGAILTNYAWEPTLIDMSRSLAEQNHLDSDEIYFGVDVWAQVKPEDKNHPRITYPRSTGGGTNTGVAVAECQKRGVSAGIFGPAWCWEHFQKSYDGHVPSQAMWEGVPLPKDTECYCYDGKKGAAKYHITNHLNKAIVHSALEYPAGSGTYFHTDFQSAFLTSDDRSDKYEMLESVTAQLGQQSILPRFWRSRGDTKFQRLLFELRDEYSRAVISYPCSSEPMSPVRSGLEIELFKLALAVPHRDYDHKVLTINIDYRSLCRPPHPPMSFFVIDSDGERSSVAVNHNQSSRQQATFTLYCEDNEMSRSIVSLGVSVSATNIHILRIPIDILSIHQITAYHENYTESKDDSSDIVDISLSSQVLTIPTITNLHCIEYKDTPIPHIRLAWSLHDIPAEGIHLPTSDITGSIEYFSIYIDGRFYQRVYGLQMILPDKLTERWKKNGLSVRVDCVRFGGMVFSGEVQIVTAADAEWEMVATFPKKRVS